MKVRNVIYIILTIIFGILTYIYIDRGINVKTKNIVNYEENIDTIYKVKLLENDVYQDNYLDAGHRYVSSLVDNIDFTFNYKKIFSQNINGYYSYNITANLIAYKDNKDDIIWNNKYTLLDNQVKVLNQIDEKDIKINEKVSIDFDRYKSILDDFIKVYGINLSGYLELKLNINQNLNIKSIKNDIIDEKSYKVIIPLNSDTFRIELNPQIKKKSSYYDFSNKERINYLLLVFGALCFSIMIANLSLITRNLSYLFKKQNNYTKELKKIFNEYSDILVNVKRFYNKKKYNLIYVDNFNELIDVYNKVGNPITYREIKKDYETIFLITDGDNAWIYRMISDKKPNK